jgi:cation transport protein ChaC
MQRADYWGFGYGSLMWKPGFDFVERRLARLEGFKRKFALASWHYRGTRELPGLVLGLDWAPGAVCTGVAFRIDADAEADVRVYLAERELVSYAYFETVYPLTLLGDGGDEDRTCDAVCYVVDRTHDQYAGGLSLETQADAIVAASGTSGPNVDYLLSTAEKLAELGIEDDEVAALVTLVEQRRAA